MADKEIRNYSFSEIRKCDPEKRTIEGYAAVFDSESQDLGGFNEVISREAFQDVIEKSDVFALLNHSNERGILARSKYGVGSLKLEVDDLGLRYTFEAPNTALGNEVLEYLQRGDISQSSFAFTVKEDVWEKRDGGYLRTITKIDRLFDVSPVFTPAYEATSVACARFDEVLEEERLENERKMAELQAEEERKMAEAKAEEERKLAEEAEQKKAELAGYYQQIREAYAEYLNKE